MTRERGARPADPASAIPPKPKFAVAIDWWALDDDGRAETLRLLSVWVPELVRRYGLSDQVVPPCWWKHEPLIQELLAVFQYRNQLQFLPLAPPPEPPGSPPNAPIDFHHQLSLAEDRLRKRTGLLGCNSREHIPTRVPPWADWKHTTHAEWRNEFDLFLSSNSPFARGSDAASGFQKSMEGG